MNIDTVRQIDYWAGVPICFVLSVINRITKTLHLNRKPKKEPKKILFIELSEMGSTVLAYRTMKRAKEMFPQAKLYFLIFEENRKSIDLLDIIPKENVLTIRNKSFIKLTIDTLKIINKFRKEKFDVSIDLELFSRYTSILNYFTGAPQKSGFYKFTWEGLYRGTLQTHKVTYNSNLHMGINFLALVEALKTKQNDIPMLKKYIGTTPENELPRIDFGTEAKNAMWKKLQEINPAINKTKKLIIINPDAGKYLPIRAWPIEKYAELTRRLLKNKNNYVIIMGVKSGKKHAETIINTVNEPRCINLTTKTTFKEMIDLLNISDLLITNDSGPAHFAALTPIKTVVFFGPATPETYKPLNNNAKIIYANFACSPCLSAFNHRKTPCKDNQCLKTISVDYVYDVVTNFLKIDKASTI